ncbi:MAG: DUF4199 domain-containing protein [Cytophagales bacterium]|nr:MAG: DUF4199 domain-containing protein [Cytophagales bacterium]
MTTELSENEKPSTTQIALRYGLISAGAGILISLLQFYVVGTNSGLSWLIIPISILVLVVAMNDYKKRNQGYMSLGAGFGLGTMSSVISAVIGGFFNILLLDFIDPTIIEKLRKDAVLQVQQAGMGDEQIEQAMQFTDFLLNTGVMFVLGVISSLILGGIISLIISAILHKNREEIA